MTAYARIEERTARLDTDFGFAKAVEWFGQEAVDALPKYVRGPKAGRPKGFYVWTKVVRGGWVRDGVGGGHVENRVGAIIERRLHAADSTRYGLGMGEMIDRLGQGQTVASRTADRIRGARIQLAEAAEDQRAAFREEMAKRAKLRAARRAKPEVAEILLEMECKATAEARFWLTRMRQSLTELQAQPELPEAA